MKVQIAPIQDIVEGYTIGEPLLIDEAEHPATGVPEDFKAHLLVELLLVAAHHRHKKTGTTMSVYPACIPTLRSVEGRKVRLRSSAERANPILRKIFKGCSCFDTVVRIT